MIEYKSKLEEIKDKHKEYSKEELAKYIIDLKNEYENIKKTILIGTAMLDDIALVNELLTKQLSIKLKDEK